MKRLWKGGISRQFGSQHLERDPSLQRFLNRQINSGHGALADDLFDPVAGNLGQIS
jgi:hypothetical protein